MIADGFRPVVNAKSGRPALMGKAASETREDGSVVEKVRLVRPLQRQLFDRNQYARSSFEEVPSAAFAAAWSAELASLPEFDESTLYVSQACSCRSGTACRVSTCGCFAS